jgi:hypothetical protein
MNSYRKDEQELNQHRRHDAHNSKKNGYGTVDGDRHELPTLFTTRNTGNKHTFQHVSATSLAADDYKDSRILIHKHFGMRNVPLAETKRQENKKIPQHRMQSWLA